MRVARITLTLSLWFVAGVTTGLLVAIGAPALFGHHSFVVLSGSMEPSINTGDVVVDEPISPLAVRAGDVVTFRSPDDQGVMVTHRVRKAIVRGDTVEFVTKGDANNAVERWSMPSDGELGRVRYRVPRVGFVLATARTPWGRVGLVLIPLLSLAGYALNRIWRAPLAGGTVETAA